jgi:hypothetical protein
MVVLIQFQILDLNPNNEKISKFYLLQKKIYNFTSKKNLDKISKIFVKKKFPLTKFKFCSQKYIYNFTSKKDKI